MIYIVIGSVIVIQAAISTKMIKRRDKTITNLINLNERIMESNKTLLDLNRKYKETFNSSIEFSAVHGYNEAVSDIENEVKMNRSLRSLEIQASAVEKYGIEQK